MKKYRRRCAGAGRPFKSVSLREELFRWFVSVRGASSGRLPVAQVRRQARVLREAIIRCTVRHGCKTPVPHITSAWLLRWRREYQVSLRLPNRRWKVRHDVLTEGFEITWLNLIRVRRLCQLLFGYDPTIAGFDQKPVHFHESGSRMRMTLAWRGARDVSLN